MASPEKGPLENLSNGVGASVWRTFSWVWAPTGFLSGTLALQLPPAKVVVRLGFCRSFLNKVRDLSWTPISDWTYLLDSYISRWPSWTHTWPLKRKENRKKMWDTDKVVCRGKLILYMFLLIDNENILSIQLKKLEK